MKENFSRLRGFQDIYGDNLYYFELIENTFKKYAKIYGFQEIKVPVLERTELFVRSIGTSTDIVRKEMFTFEDRGGRSVTLRPEGTASVVRAFLENNLINDPRYSKVFYSGPMFRAERPQAGRLRQFHQLGVEWFGQDDPLVDFEVISMLNEILSEIGLGGSIKFSINSVGCEVCSLNYKEKLKEFFDAHRDKFCDDCKERREKNVLRIFDCKNETCKLTLEEAPKTSEYLCDLCKYHFDTLINLMSKSNINFEVNPNLVRGLDYYTRNVFEVTFEGIGSQNAIAGGGRYNHLVEEFGGPYTPAFGFAIGVERTIIALKQKGIKVNEEKSIAICTISTNEIPKSLEISKITRSRGIPTQILSHYGKISKQLKVADKLNVTYTLIIGEDEVKTNTIQLKNMLTGEQKTIKIEDLEKNLL
jgi:histidyl-tRNA synthetase